MLGVPPVGLELPYNVRSADTVPRACRPQLEEADELGLRVTPSTTAAQLKRALREKKCSLGDERPISEGQKALMRDHK